MATKAQKIRLAVFLLASGGILVFLLAVIAGLRLLEERVHYFIEFESTSLSGLSRGAPVNYFGRAIGQVAEITIPEEAINTIVVDISLKPDLAYVIRTDTRATVYTHPLSGQKHIELLGGSQEAAPLPPQSRIRASDTFFADIERRTDRLFVQLEELLENMRILTKQENRIQVARLLEEGALLAENANLLIEQNRQAAGQIVRDMAAVSSSLARTTASLQTTADTLARVVTSSGFRRSVEDIEASAAMMRQQLAGPVPALITRADHMMGTIDTTFIHIDRTVLQSRTDLLQSLQDLQEALQNIRDATELIREDPSILIRGRGGE